MSKTLSPMQQVAFAGAMDAFSRFDIIGLTACSGAGKTTVLREMHERTGGAWICIRDLLHAMRSRHPLALEETFEQIVAAALKSATHVYIDDLSLLSNVVQCGGSYPRYQFLSAVLESLAAQAESDGKKLIYSTQCGHHELSKRGDNGFIPGFTPEDYAFFCREFLGAELADRLDYRKVHRFARSLQVYDLKSVASHVRRLWGKDLDTDRYIDALRNFGMVSNVSLCEVQQVSLYDLKGVDDIIESLEANIVVPLEQLDLAGELQLKPKRGVLLVGPPGTGKTTVGRALAHRLKSKFFLIDGTYISGSGDFYYRINEVFNAAKHNAPSIIFVDDSDAIFESGEELGLYRYLLTMLDGLESESAGQVCVMMTAMDVGHLPPALVRSGRVELWLEMRLPDIGARSAILTQLLQKQAAILGGVDVPGLAEATDGFTGADLKRLLEDGKNLLAYDKVRGMTLQPVTDYFLRAVATVRDNKARYAEADARARQQRPVRAPHYNSVQPTCH